MNKKLFVHVYLCSFECFIIIEYYIKGIFLLPFMERSSTYKQTNPP